MTFALLVPPTAEPVSLADAKAWLRVETPDDDTLVGSLIAAARAAIEAYTGRVLVSQTWRLRLDAWPEGTLPRSFGTQRGSRDVIIPLVPAIGIVAVRVFDAAGVSQVLASGAYTLRGAPDGPWLDVDAAPAPGRSRDGIEIDVVCGYGTPADVPPPLRQAILTLVARLYENRGDSADPPATLLRGTAHSLAAPYRRVRLA